MNCKTTKKKHETAISSDQIALSLKKHFCPLPDDRLVKLSGRRFEAPEVHFRLSLSGMKVNGVTKLVFKVINNA
jgi:hypothetical protein